VTEAVRAAATSEQVMAARETSRQEGDPQLWRDAAVATAAGAALAAGDLALVEAIAAGYGSLLTAVLADGDASVRLDRASPAERRRRGAFATPPPLAATLARHALPGDPDLARSVVPRDRDPAGRAAPGQPGQHRGRAPAVVDPACGPGALLLAALDRLLALGVPAAEAFGALHGVDADAAAVAVCRTRLVARAVHLGVSWSLTDAATRIVVGDALLGPTPACPGEGLAWHEAFPAVLDRQESAPEPVTGWRGGFDAVLANPPWERLKVTRRDWAGLPPPQLRADRAAGARSLRDAGRHPLTGTGELNAYLPFAETCWRLLAPSGRASLVVPAGIASDRSAAALLRATLDAGALEVLHFLEPEDALFEGVSRRVGVAVVVLGAGPQVERPGRAATVAVGVRDPDAVPPGLVWPLDARTVRQVNPNTGTAPLFGTARDAAVVTGVHARLPVLKLRSAGGMVIGDPWQVRLVTPLHMTRDARHFATSPGAGLLPLWEAKHAWLLDHRGGGTPGHRYWVPEPLVHDRFAGLMTRGWLAGYRNVTTADSPRTLLPTALPIAAVGNSLPLLTAPRLPLLLAALASLPADYVARQKHAGANLNFFKLEQVPLPPPEAYDVPAPWDPTVTVATWTLRRFALACRWDESMAGLAGELRSLGIEVPKPVSTAGAGLRVSAAEGSDPLQERRARALAELDAVHAVLFGWSRADLEHALTTFRALQARQERTLGRFLTRELALAAYDRLTAS
jgi:hypothetical protein